MGRIVEQLTELAPALAFLLAGVPLATLLERLGFFDAVAAVIVGRSPRGVPVWSLWLLAAVTTVVLNLDTTIVLLTPLYLRLARRTGDDETSLALIPLLLTGLASSVLPVSNLTTLIAAEHSGLSTVDVVAHLGAPSLVACVVGWWAYRRRNPERLRSGAGAVGDGGGAVGDGAGHHRALVIGGGVVGAVLVGFVGGPAFGIAPWMVALGADAVLVIVLRVVPWRDVPVTTALFVVAVAAVVAAVVPEAVADEIARHDGAVGVIILPVIGAALAGVVNNLPALLVGLGPSTFGWSGWAWLLGVNAGAVLLPLGALANLLWLRILAAEGLTVRWRAYPGLVMPIAGPAFLAAVAALLVERVAFG